MHTYIFAKNKKNTCIYCRLLFYALLFSPNNSISLAYSMIANITDYFTYDLFAPSLLDILLGGL